MLAVCQSVEAGILVNAEVKEEVPVTVSEENLERRLRRRGPATWKVPLGAALIEDMHWVDDDLLYVGLRKDSARLENLDEFVINAATGGILWRNERRNEHDRYSFIYGSSESLLFSVGSSRGKRQLVALDTQTGAIRWSFELRAARKATPITPTIVADAGLVIAVDGRKGTATAIRINTGDHLWQRQLAGSNSAYLPLFAESRELWDPNGQLQSVSVSDGQTRWTSDVHLELTDNVPAQFADGHLFVVHGHRNIVTLDARDGSVLWRHTLPPGVVASNIYPYENRVYVRTRASQAGEDNWSHHLVSLDSHDGKAIWTHTTANPSLSNLIHSTDSVYHATGSSVFSVNRATGQEQFAVEVTNTGRSFPVRLRMLQNHIAYIGELVIAGLDPGSGSILFSHGMTPISADTSLNALDVSIPRLREQMGAVKSGAGGTSFSLGEAQRYQNMANSYHRQAQSYSTQSFMARSSGNSSAADSARFRAEEARGAANRASSQARTMAAIEMSMAVMNLAAQLNEMWRLGGIKATVDRQTLFRNSILANYSMAENVDYVFRPHSRYRAVDDKFVGIDVIDLETGASRFNYLSPSYQSYGLWNLIDFERRMVIHHGVGLDSSDYRYSEPRKANMVAPKLRTIETFLLAVPVRLP